MSDLSHRIKGLSQTRIAETRYRDHARARLATPLSGGGRPAWQLAISGLSTVAIGVALSLFDPQLGAELERQLAAGGDDR
jgi:hypothetical protein